MRPLYKRRVLEARRRSAEAHGDDDTCWCRPEVIPTNAVILIVHNDILLEH